MAANTEIAEVLPAYNRQASIDALDIGESVAIARRIDLTYGCAQISKRATMLRGALDVQANRSRRKDRSKEFTVENGGFVSREGALLLTAVITRTR